MILCGKYGLLGANISYLGGARIEALGDLVREVWDEGSYMSMGSSLPGRQQEKDGSQRSTYLERTKRKSRKTAARGKGTATQVGNLQVHVNVPAVTSTRQRYWESTMCVYRGQWLEK